jgi:F0F1-type ATP synthase membrane subunit a
MEAVLTNSMGVGVRDLLEDNVGHDANKYVAMLGSIGIFVLLNNLVSLVPTLESPTAQVSVPLGCAIVVFLYYNWTGIVKHGPLGDSKHFLGPVLAMSPIMLPIEIVSNLARLLSLTVRLWVNMLVSETLSIDRPNSIHPASYFRGCAASLRLHDFACNLRSRRRSRRALARSKHS